MNITGIFKRIAINTSSQVVSKSATIILGFLTVGLLTRYLGTAKYGIYTLAFAYLAFFGVFADFGLQTTLVRDLSAGDKSDLKSAYFFIKIIMTVVSSLIALVVLFFFPYSAQIKTAIILGLFAVAAGYLYSYGTSVLQSKIRLDTVAILEVVNRFATVLVIIIVVLLHLGLNWIIGTILIGNIVTLAIVISLEPAYFKLKSLPSKLLILKIFKSAFPIGITALLGVLYFKIDTIMLSLMKSTSDVGIYSLSYKIFENIIMLWLFYMASVYPIMSRYIKQNEKKDLFSLIKISLLIAVGFSLFTICVGYFVAPLAVSILGGKNFFDSILPFRILIFALPLVFINNLLYYLLLSMSRVKPIFYALIVSVLFNAVVNYFIIPRYGIVGTAASTVLTEGLTLIGYSLGLRYKKLFV